MTRAECENMLLALAKQADAVVRAYNPDVSSVSLDVRNGQINVNAHTELDDTADFGDIEATYLCYATEFPDGDVWHTEDWVEGNKRLREMTA